MQSVQGHMSFLRPYLLIRASKRSYRLIYKQVYFRISRNERVALQVIFDCAENHMAAIQRLVPQ